MLDDIPIRIWPKAGATFLVLPAATARARGIAADFFLEVLAHPSSRLHYAALNLTVNTTAEAKPAIAPASNSRATTAYNTHNRSIHQTRPSAMAATTK
jgi:hypothetical protein